MAARTKAAIPERRFSSKAAMRQVRHSHSAWCLRWWSEALMPAHMASRTNQSAHLQIAAHVGRNRFPGSILPVVLESHQCLLLRQRRMAAQTAIGFILTHYAHLPEHPRTDCVAVQAGTPIGVLRHVAGTAGLWRQGCFKCREARRRIALRRYRLTPISCEKLRCRVRRRMFRCRCAINHPGARHRQRQYDHQDCNTYAGTLHTEFHIAKKPGAGISMPAPATRSGISRGRYAPAVRGINAQPPQGLAGAAPPLAALVLLALGVLYALSIAMMALAFKA